MDNYSPFYGPPKDPFDDERFTMAVLAVIVIGFFLLLAGLPELWADRPPSADTGYEP